MAWPLYAKYGHCFEAFKHMVDDPDKVLDELKKPDGSPAVNDEVKNALVKDIRRRMTPQPLKIRADVELTCFAYDGVLHIKEAMRAAEAVSTEECKVKISLVASPLYVVSAQTLDKDFGVKLVDQAVEACAAAIANRDGKIVVKEAARAVSERDDRLLAEKMEKLQKAQEENQTRTARTRPWATWTSRSRPASPSGSSRARGDAAVVASVVERFDGRGRPP